MKERALHFDLLRIAASFAVVLLHVSNSFWYGTAIGGYDFTVMLVYNSLTRFAVPCFFMLSGLFLLDPSRELTVGQALSKIGKLLRCFYIWSLFYAFQSVLLNILRGGFGSISREMWDNAFTRLINGHGHMWFLMDLMGFYLLAPILRKICEDIRILGYFLFLWVFSRFLLENALAFLNWQTLSYRLTLLRLSMLTGFIGYFLGGYFLNKIRIRPRVRTLIYGAGILAVVSMILLTFRYSEMRGEYVEEWLLPSSLTALVFSIAVFVFFANFQAPHAVRSKSRLLVKISNLTFFVYMAHPFFAEKLNLLGIRATSFNPLFSIPLLSVGIFAACLAGGFLIGKIPVIGKWILLK